MLSIICRVSLNPAHCQGFRTDRRIDAAHYQFEYKGPMATATLPDRSSLLCCSGPRLLWICNTSLFVSGTTECDESHRRAYLRRIKYLHARFLTVIPLPGHFDLPLASLDSHVFYNAVTLHFISPRRRCFFSN